MATSGDASDGGTVVVVNGETMGRGDDRLGATVLGSFLRAMATTSPRPDAILFYNAAVRLLAPRSESLDALRALDDAGVDLLACVTCLEFYGLTEKIQVGQVSNMRDIVQRMMTARKVITV